MSLARRPSYWAAQTFHDDVLTAHLDPQAAKACADQRVGRGQWSSTCFVGGKVMIQELRDGHRFLAAVWPEYER